MSLSAIDLEMENWQEMFKIPDSPRAETPSLDFGPIPDSPTSSLIPSSNTPAPITTAPVVQYDATLGLATHPSPSTDLANLFDIPDSRPSTPMLVDDQNISSSSKTEGRHASEPAQPSQPEPPRRQPPPNMIRFLPIISGRAVLMRSALSERRAEAAYIRSKIDSVKQDMAELSRQLDTMEALRVMRSEVERAQRESFSYYHCNNSTI
jgi:hypothetical protein